MPLLLRRRSLLDLVNSGSDNGDGQLHFSPMPEKPSRSSLHPADGLKAPRPRSEHANHSSRLSHEVLREHIADAGFEANDVASRAKRFSMVKLRNFSESHLSIKARETLSTEPPPALPSPNAEIPAIVRTAPTLDHKTMLSGHDRGDGNEEVEHTTRVARPSLFVRSLSRAGQRDGRGAKKAEVKNSTERKNDKPKSSLRWRRHPKHSGLDGLLSAIQAPHRDDSPNPPSYGENSTSDLALPVPDHRFSDSSRSDGSNNSDRINGQTTTTHTVSTHTTFFKLPRRNRNRNSLFPLPAQVPVFAGNSPISKSGPSTPRASESGLDSQDRGALSPPPTALHRRHTESSPTKQRNESFLASSPQTAGSVKMALSFAEPSSNIFREGSMRSRASSRSSPLQPPTRLGVRDRASTNSSDRMSRDIDTPPQYPNSIRNSTSTVGRPSFAGLLTLSRFRQGSEPQSPRHGSPGTRSKSNSFALSREALIVPEREEGDTPGKYLERLEAAVARSVIAGILSKSADPFAQSVLRSYTRRFMFFGEPIDMSLRKFLLEAELPKETQQVDRVIQALADRYHECNPGIFTSPDQAYIIAFSLMMLHTDAFNKNNKRKMQKHDYIKNTSGQHVSDDILACFYDNICYTPFVHYEEEVDINGERVLPFKPKKSKFKAGVSDSPGKKPSGPVDPYNLLVENKLDILRPSIKDTIALDDPYNYRGSQGELDPAYLQRAFTHTGVLQIISARSRPAAYEGQLGPTQNLSDPTDTQAGIVDLKITKVGTLWRKAPKKKKARSPWQEWGAVLTGSQLYLFKNLHWAKSLVQQFNTQQKLGHPRIPVVFKPPLQDFKPDALIKTDNAVALVDATYTRHKHAFTFFRSGGQEEVFLADNESELNDWLALINYAAAFRAAGVRIRGMVGGHEEYAHPKESRRLDSSASVRSAPQSPNSTDSAAARAGLNGQLQRQVMAARRQIIVSKIADSEKEISEAVRRLDEVARNARHLLILAPIAPKTRDDVIHAAAQADASIKWIRRDIWRLKCHRDVLAMDVRLDGITATDVEKLAEQRLVENLDSEKQEQPGAMSRMGSKMNATRSPPLSPASPARSARPSTTSSKDTLIGKETFKTSLIEPSSSQLDTDSYQIPPLQLDLQHRGSITSAMLSVSSFGEPTLSHTPSTASMRPSTRVDSNILTEATSRHDPITPTQSLDNGEAERLARASTMTPEHLVTANRTKATENTETGIQSTPDSGKRKGARRSLHRTLRDAHGSVHRHRRGKDSESTIRSGMVEGDDANEGTPGLQRGKGRFILHGKQASVVQLDWPSEQLEQRRERFKQERSVMDAESEPIAVEPNDTSIAISAPPSPLVKTFRHTNNVEFDSEDDLPESMRSTELKSDAEATDAFIGQSQDESDSEGNSPTFFYDANEESDGDANRSTVSGPDSASQRSLKYQAQPKSKVQIERAGEERDKPLF